MPPPLCTHLVRPQEVHEDGRAAQGEPLLPSRCREVGQVWCQHVRRCAVLAPMGALPGEPLVHFECLPHRRGRVKEELRGRQPVDTDLMAAVHTGSGGLGF